MTEQTVVQALAAVMADVQAVGKEGHNSSQNYAFRGIDGVMNAVAAYGIRMDPGSVRSRLNQLRKDDGAVRKVGCKTVPKPLGSGRPSTTWALT